MEIDRPAMTDKMELCYLNLHGAQQLFGKESLEHLPVRVTWHDTAELSAAKVSVNARVCKDVFEAASGRRIGGLLPDGCAAKKPSDAQIAAAQAAYQEHRLNFETEYLCHSIMFETEYLRHFIMNALIE